jgi:hypothetical protein
MLIIALVLAVIGLAALVTAVVTSNELIAWVCIAASVIGVVLLIIDAVRERSRGQAGRSEPQAEEDEAGDFDAEYPDEPAADEEAETTAAPAETTEEEVAEEDRKTR